MPQPQRPLPLIWTLLAIALWSSPLPSSAQSEIEVRFNVPDKTSFVETVRLDKMVVQGTERPRRTLFESKSKYVIRKTNDGYSAYFTPVKPLDVAVPQDLSVLLGAAMASMRLRYDVDDKGVLRDVAGVEAAIAEIESLLGPEARPILNIAGLTAANAEQIKQLVVLEWRLRGVFDFASWSGRTIPLGHEHQVAAGLYPSVLGVMFRAPGRLRSSGPVPCGGTRCVQITSSTETKDPALGEVLSRYTRNLLVDTASLFGPKGEADAAIPVFTITDPHESVTLTRLFDPATGLQHRHRHDHELRATMVVTGRTVERTPIHIKFRREYSYDYR